MDHYLEGLLAQARRQDEKLNKLTSGDPCTFILSLAEDCADLDSQDAQAAVESILKTVADMHVPARKALSSIYQRYGQGEPAWSESHDISRGFYDMVEKLDKMVRALQDDTLEEYIQSLA